MPELVPDRFRFSAQFPEIRFGHGALAELPDLLASRGYRRPFLIGSATHAAVLDRIEATLVGGIAGRFGEVAMHVPAAVVARARAAAELARADVVVAVGGGSAIGLAKALALQPGLPIVAAPTTYAGSEMTAIYGLSEDGEKRTGRNRAVLPQAVVYDPELLLSLPARTTGPSGLNALAHAMEALYAPNANPIVSAMAEEAVRIMATTLPRTVRDGADLALRTDTLYAALLAGMALSASEMGLHHKLCHTLGGTFGLPHAQTHAIMLPHSAAFNLPAAPHAAARMAQALGVSPATVPDRLFALLEETCEATGLHALGMDADMLDRAAVLAMAQRYPNPRALDWNAVRALLASAHAGRRPASPAMAR